MGKLPRKHARDDAVVAAQAVPVPAPPSVTGITFDQPAYSPGQTITATVTFTPGTSEQTTSLTGTATDKTTSQTGKLTVTFATVAPDPTTVSAADTGNRTWTQTSPAGGTVATFTAVALCVRQ